VAITIQHKRDTASNWTSNNPTMSAGEIGVETDTGKFKFGDGSTAWSSLDYFEPEAPSGPSYSPVQGSTSGYTSGGSLPAATNTVDKFPLSSDGNATDVGDLTVARSQIAGQSSSSSGYTSGGSPVLNVIDKFPFATDANATDVGDLSVGRNAATGQSSADNGYTSGGDAPATQNVIDKFPFSSDANATDVGDLTVARTGAAGQSSPSHGYTSVGRASPYSDVIDKFPFSSDANATDVGDMTVARNMAVGQSSSTHGYTSGGLSNYWPPPIVFENIIDKFPFSSDANATDVGDLTAGRNGLIGQSSTASGYTSGGLGSNNFSVRCNTIDKFPFSSDANSTDVGDIPVARNYGAGQQV
jgi:hypothetical protein